MKYLRKFLLISIPIVMVLFLSPLFSRPAQAATYADNKLVDYGIPTDVIEVLLYNSLDKDGNRASETWDANTLTVGNIQTMTKVGLAQQATLASGKKYSVPDTTVSSWVQDVVEKNQFTISTNVYKHMDDASVIGDGKSLDTKTVWTDGGDKAYVFNSFMEILASATDATEVDLTGLTYKVSTTNNLAGHLMNLFNTSRLPNLHTLNVSYDNITNTSAFYDTQNLLFTATDAQTITSMDISNNNMSFSNSYQGIFSAMSKLTYFSVVGNNITSITGWVAAAIQDLSDNLGEGDLGDVTATDYGSLVIVAAILNSGKGSFDFSDASINTILNGIYNNGWIQDAHKLNPAVIEKYLDQLSLDTVNMLLDKDDDVKNNDDFKKILEDRKTQLENPETVFNSLSVAGSVNFGDDNILSKMTSATILDNQNKDNDIFTLDATIAPGYSLKASVSNWIGEDSNKSEFSSILTLPIVKSALNSDWATKAQDLDNSEKILYTNMNTNKKSVEIKESLENITMKILNIQDVKPNVNYKTTINWTISDTVGETQQ